MYSRFAYPLAWILSLFLLLFVYTKLFGPIPFSVTSVTTQKSTTFDVTGEGKVIAKPDMSLVSAGISVKSFTVKDAQEQINSTINKVSQAVKQLGVKDKAKRASQIAGFKLGRIINYSENQPGVYRPMVATLDTVGKPIGGTQTEVEPGSSEITVSVTLSYETQ